MKNVDEDQIIAKLCFAMAAENMMPTTEHQSMRMECFSGVHVKKRMWTENYSGMRIYCNMYRYKDLYR